MIKPSKDKLIAMMEMANAEPVVHVDEFNPNVKWRTRTILEEFDKTAEQPKWTQVPEDQLKPKPGSSLLADLFDELLIALINDKKAELERNRYRLLRRVMTW